MVGERRRKSHDANNTVEGSAENSGDVETKLDLLGSIGSTTSTGSGKIVRFDITSTSSRGSGGSGSIGSGSGSYSSVPGWDDNFKPIRGARVSTFTNASYSVAVVFKTNRHIGLLGCVMVILGCVLGAGLTGRIPLNEEKANK
jgi:hypothetical protein